MTSTLSVLDTLYDDFTEYKCFIENSYGNDTAVFKLDREVVPSIILPVLGSIFLGAVFLSTVTLTVLYVLRIRNKSIFNHITNN